MSEAAAITLKEMLAQRSLKELLALVRENEISFPWDISQQDQDILWNILSDGYTEEDSIDALEEEEDYSVVEREEDESQEAFEKRQAAELHWRQTMRHEAVLYQEAKAHQDALCAAVADRLLADDKIEQACRYVNDQMEGLLFSTQETEPTDGFYEIDAVGDETWAWKKLEREGYLALRRLSPERSDDMREHIIGFRVPVEVITAFRRKITPEWRQKCRVEADITDCCYTVACYHRVSTLQIAYTLYQKLYSAKAQEEQHGQEKVALLTQEDFAVIAWELSGKGEIPNTVVCSFEGTVYVLESWLLEILEDDPDVTMKDIIAEYNPNEKYYIPEIGEMEDYNHYGYWHMKKPYLELEQFIREYYLDEQMIENTGRSMFRMALSLSEEDESFGRIYSNDDVDRRTEDEMFDIAGYLRDGTSIEEIYKTLDHITSNINKSAQKQLRTLLEQCAQVTPRFELHGFSAAQL